jgi:uncharacterized protein (DUF427 family)
MTEPTIERDPRRIRVMYGGHEIADSDDVLVVREPGRSPVRYFPKKDVEMAILGKTDRQTPTASKGVASYFTIYRDAHVVENAIWSFENPPPEYEAIAGRLAFQPVHFEFATGDHSPVDWDLDNSFRAGTDALAQDYADHAARPDFDPELYFDRVRRLIEARAETEATVAMDGPMGGGGADEA